jgi:hypothetical protein
MIAPRYWRSGEPRLSEVELNTGTWKGGYQPEWWSSVSALLDMETVMHQ